MMNGAGNRAAAKVASQQTMLLAVAAGKPPVSVVTLGLAPRPLCDLTRVCRLRELVFGFRPGRDDEKLRTSHRLQREKRLKSDHLDSRCANVPRTHSWCCADRARMCGPCTERRPRIVGTIVGRTRLGTSSNQMVLP